MSRPTDIRVTGAWVYLIPAPMRMPLKFGAETVREVTCARVRVRVVDRAGRVSEGWGETPLSVTWGWPSTVSYAARLEAMLALVRRIAAAWAGHPAFGHPLELGWDFLEERLAGCVGTGTDRVLAAEGEVLPWLAALICASAFDVALHDAFGVSCGQPVYALYGREHLSRDLSAFLEAEAESGADFRGMHPADFLEPRRDRLSAWHLVGGLDPVGAEDLRGDEPDDGHPVLLEDWIRCDGLTCLKIKLRGTDAAWDYARLVRVGRLGMALGVEWLTADFNCTVRDPGYVIEILRRFEADEPELWSRLLYVEQPFAYDLERNRVDVRAVSALRPLFLDESAHDWRVVRLGRRLGWTGVALKTCKTQSGALLSLCWARAHGMELMVQDLTNPMLAQIPHLLLAAHAGTLHGVETNGMQFYPAVSRPEAAVHPGCFRRRDGCVDLSTVVGEGFGYRLGGMRRVLPPEFCGAGG